MKPESGRVYASLSPSLSRASSIDRSIASRCLRSRRARRALPSSLVRDNPIPSRAIHSSRGRAAPSSPASIASTAPRARRSTYIHKHQLIDQTKKNNHGTHAQQKINKEPDRWHHPRARLRGSARNRVRFLSRGTIGYDWVNFSPDAYEHTPRNWVRSTENRTQFLGLRKKAVS